MDENERKASKRELLFEHQALHDSLTPEISCPMCEAGVPVRTKPLTKGTKMSSKKTKKSKAKGPNVILVNFKTGERIEDVTEKILHKIGIEKYHLSVFVQGSREVPLVTHGTKNGGTGANGTD